MGLAFFSSYFLFLSSLSFPFLVRAFDNFSVVSLSLPLLNVFASLSNEIQLRASNQANLYCSGFFFFLGDLMVDLAVVVWVVDSAFSGIVWVVGCGLRFWVGWVGVLG